MLYLVSLSKFFLQIRRVLFTEPGLIGPNTQHGKENIQGKCYATGPQTCLKLVSKFRLEEQNDLFNMWFSNDRNESL